MSSSPKRQPKRAKARTSPGPKTPSGKARSAQNSRTHGLSLPVSCDPALSDEVEAVVHTLVRKGDSSELKELVQRFQGSNHIRRLC